MKKIYLTLFLAIINIVSTQAKKEPDFKANDFAKYNIDDFDGVADGIADFMTAAMNIKANFGLNKQGYVQQITILDCPGMNKQDIYTQAVLWFESFCSDDKKAELRLDPNQGSTLVARKRIIDVASKEFTTGLKIEKNRIVELDEAPGDHTINLLVDIRLDIKDEKCRLTTTIEDYGLYTSVSSIGGPGKATVGGAYKPIDCYPFAEDGSFSFRDKKKKESNEKYEKEKQKFKEYLPKLRLHLYGPQAVAYVASFLVTQIVHDKMVESITSAPSFGNNDEW